MTTYYLNSNIQAGDNSDVQDVNVGDTVVVTIQTAYTPSVSTLVNCTASVVVTNPSSQFSTTVFTVTPTSAGPYSAALYQPYQANTYTLTGTATAGVPTVVETKYILAGSYFSVTGYIADNLPGTVSETLNGPQDNNLNDLYANSTMYSFYSNATELNLYITDVSNNVTNSGWDVVKIGGTGFSRASATYTQDYATGRDNWRWVVPSNPFTNGVSYEILFEDTSGGSTPVPPVTDFINHLFWHRNIRVKSIAHMNTSNTLAWTTEATTSSSNSTMISQIANSTKSMVTTNCTVTGGTNDGVTKTITPTGVGPYKVVLKYVHDTSAADTGKDMTGVIKEFVISGTVLDPADTLGVKFATIPEPVQYVIFDGAVWSEYTNAAGTDTENRAIGIDGTNNYALTRYGPSKNIAYQSDHNNRYATFTNVNCTVWSADGTTQNPTNIQSGVAFRIKPTNAGPYSCTGVIITASNLVKTMITTGRADSTESTRTGYGVQIFKENEPLYPRLDTGDKAAFFNSYHTGTLTKGSTTVVSVPGIDLSGGDWGIASSPSSQYWEFTQTTIGSINVTRTTNDPSSTTASGWELRTYRLNA